MIVHSTSSSKERIPTSPENMARRETSLPVSGRRTSGSFGTLLGASRRKNIAQLPSPKQSTSMAGDIAVGNVQMAAPPFVLIGVPSERRTGSFTKSHSHSSRTGNTSYSRCSKSVFCIMPFLGNVTSKIPEGDALLTFAGARLATTASMSNLDSIIHRHPQLSSFAAFTPIDMAPTRGSMSGRCRIPNRSSSMSLCKCG